MKIKKMKKQTERRKYGSFWGYIKNNLSGNPYIGLAAAIFILLLGAYIAAVINFISSETEALVKFIISFTICLLLLATGFLFFLPFWNFRKKYSFLEGHEDTLAIKLVSIYKRSKQTLTSFNGISAVQLFKLETHTNDRHIIFSLSEVFSLKSKYFNLSKLKDKDMLVPIKLYEWLKNPAIPAPDYGPLVNAHLYEWLNRMIKEDKKKFEGIIDNWDIVFEEKVPKVTAIHYHILFEPTETVDAEELVENGLVDSVFVMNYNGDKEEHSNRQYNSLRVLINDENEGTFEGILLIISNNQRISKSEVAKIMEQILKYGG